MQFLDRQPEHALTYNDVYLVPQLSDIDSRLDVDLSTNDGTGNTIPIFVSNMNAVAGERMAEVVARRGGIVALPQDLALDALKSMIDSVKSAHTKYLSAVNLSPSIIVTPQNTESLRGEPILDNRSPQDLYEYLQVNGLPAAVVLGDSDTPVGLVTPKSLVRDSIYKPNIDINGRLKVAAVVGVNGNIEDRITDVMSAGADVLVIDTAHGHQEKMIRAIKLARKIVGDSVTIVAGNVVTRSATSELAEAGANIIKVGVGPGAMCTTRMMTGVGRPQFSAVMNCADAAAEHDATVLADGGVKHPRDVALALAAGASNVMIGSWFAGTYEAAAEMRYDRQAGRHYKSNFGMASRSAVSSRNSHLDSFEQAKKELFQEGISESRMYIDSETPSVEDIIDLITAGVRSAMTYTGARTIAEFQDKAVIGTQSAAGFNEGHPVHTSW